MGSEPRVGSTRQLHAGLVGERVVVRRVVARERGPTGGPALTDVLGTLESWAEQAVTVRRDDGSLVTVPLTEIVAGKQIPPRPPRRSPPPSGS